MIEGSGRPLYPPIQFEYGSWYREQSKNMVHAIREGWLLEKAGS